MVNGKLRLKTGISLYLNNRNYKYTKLLSNKSCIQHDAWFAGFLDLAGNFYIMRLAPHKKRKITCRLKIEIPKPDSDKNDQIFHQLTRIAEYFECKFTTRKQKSTGKQFYLLEFTKKNPWKN